MHVSFCRGAYILVDETVSTSVHTDTHAHTQRVKTVVTCLESGPNSSVCVVFPHHQQFSNTRW